MATTSSQGDQQKPYYVTTPIFYVNAAPHVGHMYTMALADVIKRWQELKGRKAFLLTGTDEHGMKIQRAAAKAGVDPKEFCDQGAEIFKDLAVRMGMGHDRFIRTTDQQHKDAVEYAWHMLEQRGYIYESKHEGWYSVSDETFYPASQVHPAIDPMTGVKHMASKETGKEVEWTSERNYHFQLSAFKDKLLEFYAANPEFILPKTRMDDVVRQVTAGLEDLSISRPRERLSWGVQVPTDSSQTVYVWLDALLNYASAVGYPFTPGEERKGGWPPDVQVIGKDIVRFHCIYWPAMLMALDLPVTKQVLTHAHWTLGKAKMAKSTGNVVSPFFALDRFGVDVMRWYLIHEGGIADDADYDNLFIIQKYKTHLQNSVGNLTSRIVRGKGWSVARAVQTYASIVRKDGNLPSGGNPGSQPYIEKSDRQMCGRISVLPEQVDRQMHKLLPNKALQAIMKIILDANGYIQQAAPWNIAKEIKNCDGNERATLEQRLDAIIFLCAEALRLQAIMLQPFMPTIAKRQLDMLGVAEDRRDWKWCSLACDDLYGVPMVDISGKGEANTLFPGLASEH